MGQGREGGRRQRRGGSVAVRLPNGRRSASTADGEDSSFLHLEGADEHFNQLVQEADAIGDDPVGEADSDDGEQAAEVAAMGLTQALAYAEDDEVEDAENDARHRLQDGEEPEEEQADEEEALTGSHWGRRTAAYYDEDRDDSSDEEAMELAREEAEALDEEAGRSSVDATGRLSLGPLLDAASAAEKRKKKNPKNGSKKNKKKIDSKALDAGGDDLDAEHEEHDEVEADNEEQDIDENALELDNNNLEGALESFMGTSFDPSSFPLLEDSFSSSSSSFSSKFASLLSPEFAEQRRKLVEKHHPELTGLLSELKNKLEEVTTKVQPLIQLSANSGADSSASIANKFLSLQGNSFLQLKNELLLCYLVYLSFYVLLKSRGSSVEFHPVVERLVEVRALLEKLRPIDEALKYPIAKLLQRDEQQRQAKPTVEEGPPNHMGKSEKVQKLRPHADLLLAPGEDEEDVKENESENEDEEEEERKTSASELYRPPRLMPVEYTGDPKSSSLRASRLASRLRERLSKSELVRSLRLSLEEQAEDGPAVEAVGADEAEEWGDGGRSNSLRKLKRKFQERTDYEEENMIRLPTNKKDKKAQASLRQGISSSSFGASALSDLTAYAEASMGDEDLSGTSRAGRIPSWSSYLSAAKAAKAAEEKTKQVQRQANELAVKFKKLEKTGKNNSNPRPPSSPSGFVSASDRQAAASRPGSLEEASALALRAAAQLSKDSRRAAKIEEHLPVLPQELDQDSKRASSKQIVRNRGLTRSRKKFEGHARVHNRIKFAKKQKKLQSVKPQARQAEGNGYAGETSGMKSSLAKSVRLA
eukprot:GHVT01006137.1.p1 GENE.GHVT01006137.1~~GHVT01006137.1.p1  ORF type:complete len:818 (+),score=250.35 GHVT01006137.1:88-2541(+)